MTKFTLKITTALFAGILLAVSASPNFAHAAEMAEAPPLPRWASWDIPVADDYVLSHSKVDSDTILVSVTNVHDKSMETTEMQIPNNWTPERYSVLSLLANDTILQIEIHDNEDGDVLNTAQMPFPGSPPGGNPDE